MTPAAHAAHAAHAFDRAIVLQHAGDGRFLGQTSPDYANMVGPFGGITAAQVLQALLMHPERLGEPVAITLNYAGPIADGAFTIETRIARTNRSTQHWIIELKQGDGIALTATAVTAVRRATWAATEASMPPVRPVDECERHMPVDWARWTHNYDTRFLRGAPESAVKAGGLDDSEVHIWIRDEPPRALDFPALAAICDAFYPRIFLRRPKMVPVGTVSLTIYFHADAAALAGHGAGSVLGVAKALNFGLGFFDQSAEIWSAAGRMLASSHQVVYYKE